MSTEQYTYVEQDPVVPPAGNELPTYNDLAQQNGPNSRFGRWKGWIEKRAAERYADVTPEERARRRERGWGDISQNISSKQCTKVSPQDLVNHRLRPASIPLHVQTSNLAVNDSLPHSPDDTSTVAAPLAFPAQIVSPTHLKINHFGSRFLPHTTSQIRCILPLLTNRIILVGHDDGLSVLDMFPQEWTDQGEVIIKGPNEAQCRPIWRGESVLQMSVLEAEDAGNGTQQGVVLAIVGPSQDPPVISRDYENIRTARMYNLASLISLARWTISHEGAQPIDLLKIAALQTPPSPSNKRHRPQPSIARSIKSLIDPPLYPSQPGQVSSYQPHLSCRSSLNNIGGNFTSNPPTPEKVLAPLRRESNDFGWDIVDDQDRFIRWATDYIPLAPSGSRLAGTSALSFATWKDEGRKGRYTGGQLLAIATKNNILLFETPKGERAYKFVKEFYTPFQPRSLAFIQQAMPDATLRHPSEGVSGRFHSHKRSDSGAMLRGLANSYSSTSNSTLSCGTHLSLFIVFDKKAVLIRLSDAVVGEVELADDDEAPPMSHIFSRISTVSTAALRARARLSLDIRESIAKWLVPVRCELPVPGQTDTTQSVYILTRGKRTHIVPCPFPTRSPPTPPLYALFWKYNPKHVSSRVIRTTNDPANEPPLLQLIAFSDNGIEVQETTLTFLQNKGKGRAMPGDLIKAEDDVGGETGFLAVGGNWDQLDNLYRSQTPESAKSVNSMDFIDRIRRDEGVYGWCRKGFEDWRVFWVGGDRSTLDSAQGL